MAGSSTPAGMVGFGPLAPPLNMLRYLSQENGHSAYRLGNKEAQMLDSHGLSFPQQEQYGNKCLNFFGQESSFLLSPVCWVSWQPQAYLSVRYVSTGHLAFLITLVGGPFQTDLTTEIYYHEKLQCSIHSNSSPLLNLLMSLKALLLCELNVN